VNIRGQNPEHQSPHTLRPPTCIP